MRRELGELTKNGKILVVRTFYKAMAVPVEAVVVF
jgi:hypothetical protein